jgi:hypothetical protein
MVDSLMPGMPELPVNVPRDQVQADGDVDKGPVFQTHRGKKATSRDVGGLPPQSKTPGVALRYEEPEE